MKQIFILEDDQNIRELVIYALNVNNYNAEGFENSKEFYSRLEQKHPDLILLDIMLPLTDGFTILKKLKQQPKTAKIPVIMLSAKNGEYDKIKGLDLGADDYISKPFSVLELISRIKAVLRRINTENTNHIIEYENIYLNTKKHQVKVNNESINLTLKEFELLHLLLLNIGIVLSRNVLLEKIWGIDFQGESRTVDMHIKTLRQKLKDDGIIIETIRGVGYKIGE